MTTAAKNAQKLLKLFGPKGEHWCTHHNAVDAKGNPVAVSSRKAFRWCMIGGSYKHKVHDLSWLYDALEKRNLKTNISAFNDRRKFPSVKKFLLNVVEKGS